MGSGMIERTPTESEKRDYRGVGQKTPYQIFLGRLADVEAKFVKLHKPFDSQCAKLDYADEIEKVERESERVYGRVRPSDIDKVDLNDLDRYGDSERFKEIRDDEEIEMVNINGIKSSIKTGHSIRYSCPRGHGFTVFIPEEMYQERSIVKPVVVEKKSVGVKK